MHPQDIGDCVYVIGYKRLDRPVKIGHGNARARLGSLQTGNHEELILCSSWSSLLIDAEQAERAIHAALVAYHIRGEWFDVTAAEAVQVIEAIDDLDLRDRARAISGAAWRGR